MGLLGGVHCVGMCGGIVTALSIGISPGNPPRSPATYLLAYNSGRILSYTIAGTIMASLGGIITLVGEGIWVRQLMTLISASFMLLLGLYLSGWWPTAILRIERLGGVIWKRIEPQARRWIPIRSSTQALVAGLLWGWIPCGLVYTALLWSLSATSPLQGGLIMLSFGVGTLPVLFGLGLFSSSITPHLQKGWIRASAGIMVSCFGIYQLTALYS